MTDRATMISGNRYSLKGAGYIPSRADTKIKLISHWAVPFLVLLALMKPTGLEDIPWLAPADYLFTALQACAFIYSLWLYFVQPISKSILLVFVLYLLYALPVVLQGDIAALTGSDSLNFIKIAVIVMITESYLTRKESESLFQGFAYASLLLLIANLLFTFVLNPGGLYGNFSDGVYGECFLSNKNTVRNPLLLGFVSSILLDALKGKQTSIRSLLIITVGFVNLALVWSATALVVFSVACVLYFISIAHVRIPNMKVFGLAAVVSWFAVVVLRRIDIFQHFIVDVLQKDMTFSGRTIMWDSAFDTIFQSPFLGQGFGSYLTYWNINNPFLQVSHCHNAFVDAMYKGGVLALLALIVLIVIACYQLKFASSRQVRVGLTITIAAFLFMGVFGELLNPCFMSVLAIATCINYLEITD